MPTIDYQHNGTEHEYEATTYTLMVYEQEFKGDLIKDVYGHINLAEGSEDFDDEGNQIGFNFTVDNWTAYPRAFWAMLKTAEAIARSEGRRVPAVPRYESWALTESRGIDIAEISQVVFNECQRGLFRAGAAEAEE